VEPPTKKEESHTKKKESPTKKDVRGPIAATKKRDSIQGSIKENIPENVEKLKMTSKTNTKDENSKAHKDKIIADRSLEEENLPNLIVKEMLSIGSGLVKRSYRIEIYSKSGIRLRFSDISDDNSYPNSNPKPNPNSNPNPNPNLFKIR
jgi:hypothetical protein